MLYEVITRLNAIYMTSIFIGGAVGSAVAAMLYSQGGWLAVAAAGAALPALALVGFWLHNRNA